MIVWIDLETSGLEPQTEHILEVGIVITDDVGAELRSRSLCVKPVGLTIPQLIERMDPYVVGMHTANGLFADLQQDIPEGGPLCMTVPVYRRYEAEDTLLHWVIDAATAELAKTGSNKEATQLLRYTPLAGNTIGFDRSFLKAHMPVFESLFSYRSIDITALNQIALRLFPKIHGIRPEARAGAKPAHRALPDIYNSIAQFHHYVEWMFVKEDVKLSIPCPMCASLGMGVTIAVPGGAFSSGDQCPKCGGTRSVPL